MTAIQQLWIASGVGAMVFFVAGVLAMSLRRPRAASVGADDAQVADLRRRLADAETINGQLRTAERQAREAMQQARDSVDAAQAAEQITQAELETAERARTQLQGELARLKQAPPTRTTPPPIPAQQPPSRPTPPSPLAVAQDKAVEKTLAERTAQLRDVTAQLEMLKARVAEAEAMRTENVRLRTQANETEFLTSEVERLRAELLAAKSIGLGGSPRAARASTPPPRAAPAVGSITEALAGAIEKFRSPQMRCIAIADSVGFPVSSYGDDGVELAAYAALFNDAAARANQFLPVAAPASIELIDQHGARVSIWPFEVAGDRLMLVNLAVAATEPQRVEGMVSDVIGILAPSQGVATR